MPKVYEFVSHDREDHSGPFGDCSFTHRFTSKSKAESAVKGKLYYGKPAEVTASEVPTKTISRWRREGKIS